MVRKDLVRKALALLVVVAVVGVALGAVGLWIPGLVGAHGHSATRSFPDGNSVGEGSELTVQITVSNFGNAARVKETLPEGFEYQSSSMLASQVTPDTDDPQKITFAVVLEPPPFTFTYTVTAPDMADTYDFSGTVDIPLADPPDPSDPRTIGGDTEVMVTALDMPMPMASREFSAATVMPGDPVTVTITASGYGEMGSVMETLPTGFSYDSSSLPAGDVSTSGQMVTFTLPEAGEMATTFTYMVIASDMVGSYDFSGELTDAGGMMPTVSGAMNVMVEAAPVTEGPWASRTFAPSSVTEGGDVRVTVEVMDYGTLGAVVEMLPAGFDYVSASIADVAENGRNITFPLLEGETSFTYTARAVAPGAGDHSFSGELIDDMQRRYPVGGDSMVTVHARVVPGAPRAERSFSMTMTGLGDEVTVTITAMNYGQIGAVVETIPMGFTYVMDSSSLEDVVMDVRELTFALLTPNSVTFTYKVMTADTAGDYDFSGNLVDDQQMMHAVAGDSRITAGPTAMRSFSATVRTGANLDVMITARDYGSLGAVVETLPNGFAYVSSDLAYVEEHGMELTFALLVPNNTSFMYTVRAPSSPGSYDFMGRLIDDAQMSHDVGGDMTVMVPPPAVQPPAVQLPPPRRRGGGGGGGGSGGGYAPPVAKATPTPIVVPTIIAPTATPTPEPTMPPPTEMPTPRPKPTEEVVMIPTVAPTPVPTEPPAPTATTAPTVVPVTPVTPVTPEAGGMPGWLIIVIIVIIVAVVIAAVGFYLMRMRR